MRSYANRISVWGMIRRGFLSAAERKELLSWARDGLAEHRLARRANAILLLDDGLSCERVAKVLYLDDDTVRGWRKLYDERGIAGLEQFDGGGSSYPLRRHHLQFPLFPRETGGRSGNGR